jgi:hypothetical protein
MLREVHAMVAKTSPAILAALFKRLHRRVPADARSQVTMRRVSAELLARQPATRSDGRALKKDANALGRWTNPGERPNWFIPISRAQEVAQMLGASQNEIDALMLVRLRELAARDPAHDGVVVGAWVNDFTQRALALDDEERAVLECFRASRVRSPYAVLDGARMARLQSYFNQLVQEHLNELGNEHAGAGLGGCDDASDGAGGESHRSLRERAEAITRGLRKLAPPPAAPLVSNEMRARRFLKDLKAQLQGSIR